MAKTRLLYLAALAFGILTALFYESSVGFILLYSLLILAAFSLISLLLAPFMISVTQTGGGWHLLKGDEVSFTVSLRNKSPLLYPLVRLRLTDSERLAYSKTDAFTLGPRERVDIDINASFPYRGVYSVGIKRVALCDFMGLFRLSFSVKAPAETVIYPCKLEDYVSALNQESLNREASNFSSLSQAHEDYSDLRPYDPHDDSRKIHWKLSAKRSQLIVKNFRSAALNKTHVLIDTRPAPSAALPPAFEDYIISLGAAVIDFAIANRLTVHLRCGFQDLHGAEASALHGRDRVWEALARTIFKDSPGVAPCLRALVISEAEACDIVLILSRLEQDDYDVLTDVCTLGHSVTLCYVYPPWQSPAPALRDMLDALENLGAQISLHCCPQPGEHDMQE